MSEWTVDEGVMNQLLRSVVVVRVLWLLWLAAVLLLVVLLLLGLDEVVKVSEMQVDSVWFEEVVVVSEGAGECTLLFCENSVDGELASMPVSVWRL